MGELRITPGEVLRAILGGAVLAAFLVALLWGFALLDAVLAPGLV